MEVFKVRSKATNGGHWRNGRRWGNDFVNVDSSDVSDSMLSDPRLEVVLCEEEVQEVIDDDINTAIDAQVAAVVDGESEVVPSDIIVDTTPLTVFKTDDKKAGGNVSRK